MSFMEFISELWYHHRGKLLPDLRLHGDQLRFLVRPFYLPMHCCRLFYRQGPGRRFQL